MTNEGEKPKADVLQEFPGFDPGLIRKAVEIVADACSPRRVYLEGPTSVGFVEYDNVELLVVVDEGDTFQIRCEIRATLAREGIDGDVRVCTSEEFGKYDDFHGRLAYDRDAPRHIIDSGDAFYDYVMEVAPRAGRRDADGMTVLPDDWDDPLDEVYSAMDANETGFACILEEGIIGPVFEAAAASGTTLYLSRVGSVRLRLPLPVQVSRDVRWTVSPVGLPVQGTGDTPNEALEDLASALADAIRKYCGPDVSWDDPTKAAFAAYVRIYQQPDMDDTGHDPSRDKDAEEIRRLAQGTPIVGYRDKDGHTVIPNEYDDGYSDDSNKDLDRDTDSPMGRTDPNPESRERARLG